LIRVAAVSLDLVQTVAFAGLVLFGGYWLKRRIPLLARYNIPAPVAGGLPVAAVLAALYLSGRQPLAFDTTLQTPLQNTFFASVGFGASVRLLRRGGPLVAVMMVLASIAAALQNVLGALVASMLGEHPLMGVLAGSVTLTGGPATGLAFAPLFESAGVGGAGTLAVSAAMVGIVSGGVLGGPIGTWLLGRDGSPAPRAAGVPMEQLVEAQIDEHPAATPAGEDVEAYQLLKHLVLMVTAVGVGSWVSAGFATLGWTLPAYIGAMIVAAVMRNVDDAAGTVGISQRAIDDLGSVALSIFLVMALMTLRLWQLAGAVVPLLVILAAQVAFVALLCLFVVPRLMGRDYEAVVMATGFCGFMLGTTANAVANMGALVERYGPAPRAYLVVPLVGAFGIDFVNALLITAAINLLQ
jgi:ESS family glutamate:Na+ symporter